MNIWPQIMIQNCLSAEQLITTADSRFRTRCDVVFKCDLEQVFFQAYTAITPLVKGGAREAILQRWNRGQLSARLPALNAKLGIRARCAPRRGVHPPVENPLGTCNTGTWRFWSNLELAKKATTCLVYIAVHEMVHLLEPPSHIDRFWELMNMHLKMWRLCRDELNRALLAYKDWSY